MTNAGLLHLTGLTKLKALDLTVNFYGTQVTDAGLSHLKVLTNLRELRLNWTRVTGAGIVELQKALPNCDISL